MSKIILRIKQFSDEKFFFLGKASKYWKYLFCALLFLPFISSGQGWIPHFDPIDTEDGLSGEVITALYQDRRGFLWIGTSGQGLNRYDGNEFKVFRHSQRDSFSLCTDFIRSILEDEHGSMWIGTARGISRLNPNNGHCDNFFTDASMAIEHYVFKDTKGAIWTNSIFGVSRFHREENKFEVIHAREDPDYYWRSAADKTGRLWLGGNNGLTSFDPTTGITQRFYPFPNEPQNQEKNRPAVKIDSYGNIWVFCWGGGLQRFHPKTGKFEAFIWQANPKFSGLANIPFDVEETFDKEGKRIFWICAEHGTFRFPLESKAFPSVEKPHALIQVGTEAGTVQAKWLISDNYGNLWFGTSGGLYRYKIEQEYPQCLATPGGTIGQVFFTQNGEALVSSQFNNPLMILDARHKLKKLFKNLPPDSKDGAGERCWSAVKDEEDGLIYAATFHGLVSYDEKRDKTRWYRWNPADSTGIAAPKVTLVLPLGNGLLLLGFWENGLQVFDTRRGKGVWRNKEEAIIRPFCLKKIKDVIWVGTDYALHTFDPQRYVLTQMTSPTESLARYYDVLLDHAGRTWAGTNHGFSQIDVQNQCVIKNYTQEDGLTGTEVITMAEDSLGRLWLGTPEGLCIFNPKTGKFHTPDKKILPPGDIWRVPNGEFWLTSNGQIKIFKPELFRDPRPSKVYFTGLRINEKDTLLDIPFEHVKQLRLRPGQNALTFSFSAIDLNDFGKTNFRYILEGLQTEWVSAGKNRRAAFVNLRPGKYRFRVRPEDAGEDGFYDASLEFVVTDFFWQRFWFKISVFTLLIVLLVSLAFMEKTRRLRLRNLRLQARLSIQEERNRISRDLHDDLGSSLGAISLLSDIALSKTGSKELRAEVRKIAESAHDLSEKVHEIIWAANPKNDTMERFISYLHQYAVSLLGAGYYDLRAQIPKDIPAATIAGEHRRALFLVYKEALNNIVSHAHATVVEINYNCTTDHVEIHIRDNGQGFDPAATHSAGNGLTNMRKRMEDIGGQFRLESGQAGTEMVFRVMV